jgi:exopolysaccharide production protein ExoZ
MYFYLIFFLLLFFPEKHLVKCIGLWAAIILFLQLYITPDTSPVLRLLAHPLTIEFIGGCLLALFSMQKKNTLSASFFLISALFFFAASIFSYILYWQTTGHVEPLGWWRILIMGIPAILIIFCLVRAEHKNFVLPGPLCRIGDASYSIYLSHVLTLSLIGRIWAEFSSDSFADNWFALPFMLLSVVAVGYISYVTVERPIIAASRKIA